MNKKHNKRYYYSKLGKFKYNVYLCTAGKKMDDRVGKKDEKKFILSLEDIISFTTFASVN